MAGDEVQRERGLVVGVEVGPVHRHDDLAPLAHHLATHEANKSQGTTPALLSKRSTCLIADLANNPRARASACPIKETASAAPVITPSVALAKDSTRLACKSSMNTRFRNS